MLLNSRQLGSLLGGLCLLARVKHTLPNSDKLLQVGVNDQDLLLSVLGAIRVGIKVAFADLLELLLGMFIHLHVNCVLVESCPLQHFLSVVLQCAILAEALKVVDGHQHFGQLGDLLELIG